MRAIYIFLFMVLSGLKLVPGSVSVSLFDFFVLLFIFYFLLNQKLKVVWSKKISNYVLTILLIQFIAVIFYQPTITKFIFAVRFIEYFLILFVASFYYINRSDIYKPLLTYYFCIIITFFIPILPFYKYGLFNYVWEAPAVVSILAFYFLITPGSRIVKVLTIVCAFVLIYASGQRTPAAAFIISAAIYFWNTGPHWRKPIFVIASVSLFSVLVDYADTRLFNTFFEVFNYSNINAFFEFQKQVSNTSMDYDTFVYGSRNLVGDDGDLSLQLRLRKWSYALFSQIDSPHTFLVGLGPGFFGGAADSSFMRVFFETGIIGLLFWYLFFRHMFRFQFRAISYITICFLLNGVFIDTLYSSRIFPLYLLILGSYLGSRRTIFHVR